MKKEYNFKKDVIKSVFLYVLIPIIIFAGIVYVTSNWDSLVYDNKSVTCEVTEKYVKETASFTGVGYHVKLSSVDCSEDISIDKDIYNMLSVGDTAKATALYGKISKEFKGFGEVKYME